MNRLFSITQSQTVFVKSVNWVKSYLEELMKISGKQFMEHVISCF